MLTTEAEAKCRDCCRSDGQRSCRASRCMAWRWEYDRDCGGGDGGKGFCGLAGVPEG